MPFAGIPSSPLIIFWSGDIAVLLRQTDIKIGNSIRTAIIIIPSDQMIWRYGLTERDLNYNITPLGTITRDYPKIHLHNISANPELPVVVCTCNFDGTSSFDTELHSLSDKVERIQRDINNLISENDSLKEMNKKLTEEIRELHTGGSID